jgi:phytoene dehydrogenase-like protein
MDYPVGNHNTAQPQHRPASPPLYTHNTTTQPYPLLQAAAMLYMLHDLNQDGARMDYPVGGSGAVVEALARGLRKHGAALLV